MLMINPPPFHLVLSVAGLPPLYVQKSLVHGTQGNPTSSSIRGHPLSIYAPRGEGGVKIYIYDLRGRDIYMADFAYYSTDVTFELNGLMDWFLPNHCPWIMLPVPELKLEL